MTKTQQLAKLAQTNPSKTKGPVEKLIEAAQGERPFTPTDAIDDHDIHVGIVRHLGLDFALGSALEQIGEARRLNGDERHAKINRAIRYLTDELRHC